MKKILAFVLLVLILCSACIAEVTAKYPPNGKKELPYVVHGSESMAKVTVSTDEGDFTKDLDRVTWYYDVKEGDYEYVIAVFKTAEIVTSLHIHLYESKGPPDE